MLLQQAAQPPASGGFPVGWDLITAVVAIVALTQPWLFALFKRLFQKGSAEFYEAGKLLVQFGNICCAVELTGTFRARHENQFLRSVGVVVEHDSNGSRRSFEWESFRFVEIGPQGEQQPKFAIASSFMITTTAPEHRTIVFFDNESRQKIESMREQIVTIWQKHLDTYRAAAFAAVAPAENAGFANTANVADSSPAPGVADMNEIYAAFGRTAEFGSLRDILIGACHWQAGTYTMTLNLLTDRFTRTYTYSAQFQLTEGDIRKLRANGEVILRYWCGVPIPGVLQNNAIVPYTLLRSK